MEKSQRRHCWECRRRCLVCDFTRPSCEKCSTSGIVCPGYNDVKPLRLRWLVPGNVTSRKRRTKGASSDDIENSLNEITTRTTAELFRRTNHLILPRVEMRTLRHTRPHLAGASQRGAVVPKNQNIYALAAPITWHGSREWRRGDVCFR